MRLEAPAKTRPLVGVSQRFWGGATCGLVFLLLGCVFVNYPGLQQDETLFAAPLFRDWSFYSISFGRARIPLMHMSYVGALKTWLYSPLVQLWAPTPALLRVPAVLIGAVTILLFGALLERAHGRRAAWIGCVLLASDPIFLLTTTFDWGPVALQHLLMTAAMLLAVQWYQRANDRWVIAAAFCCGLAFWDKAVFVWMFLGLLAGSLVFFRRVRSRFTLRCAAASAFALCFGALPLLIYNLAPKPRFATIHSNTPKFRIDGARQNLEILRISCNGSGLFGYIVRNSTDRPLMPHSAVEKASFFVHSVTGDRRANQMALALLAGLVLIPMLWRTRARDALLFSIITGGVALTLMFLSGGGDSTHHTVLLWPVPQLFLAVAFAEASGRVRFGRWLCAAAVAFFALTNLAVINQYLFQFIRNGSPSIWTDATYPLALGLRSARPPQVVAVDWGADNPLCVLNRNNPPVRIVADPFMPASETAAERQADLRLLSDGKIVWVQHTGENEIMPGVNERLMSAAHNAGFDEVVINAYTDRSGRPILQTFRFVPRR